MPVKPRKRKHRPEQLSGMTIKNMVRNPLVNPYIGEPMNRPDLQDFFSGKEFSIHLDGAPELKYKVKDKNTLRWWKNGWWGDDDVTGWEEEYYECYASSAEGLYFLFHQITNDVFSTHCRIFAIDTVNNLVTMLSGTLGLVDYTNRDTDVHPYFGYISWYDGKPAPSERHYKTHEMIQKNILWRVNNYNTIHYYVSRNYFNYQMFGEENGLVVTELCRFIRLRDNVFLFFWRDMQESGRLHAEIMDLNKFFGVGMIYGVTDFRFCCYGYTREEGRYVSEEELVEFERVFFESNDQRYALKTVFGVDLDDYTYKPIDR
ncbi:MAG: hypothetical protein GX111_10705 [Clostridiales bacterium]|jgi:hypothetical protein|nr:hypothetical protein [Clostridiales bacterium]